jgi:hypothetical protein
MWVLVRVGGGRIEIRYRAVLVLAPAPVVCSLLHSFLASSLVGWLVFWNTDLAQGFSGAEVT